MLDAAALLRETLELKQKLQFLQSQLVIGLLNVDRVVTLVTPGVDPATYVDIVAEVDESPGNLTSSAIRRGTETSEPPMIGTATPKYPFEMVKDHHYSFASVYEPRAQPSRGSISHSINPMQRPPSTWMASHRQSRAVLDSQLLMLEPPASTQPSSPVPELPSFNLTTTPTIGRGETGVRWDAEDYIKSDEFLNVDAAPVTLRKSATMMHKSGLNRSKKRDVGSISSITIGMLHRPTSWMGSQKSNNVLPTERDRSGNTEEEPTGLAASISKGLGSLAAGLGRAIPTIAVKSQSSLRYHQESIQSPQSQLSVVGDGVSKQPHYLPPGLGEPTVSGLQRTPSFGSPNIKRTNGSIRISRTAAPTTATGTNRFQSVVSKTDDTSITSSISPEVISADMHDRESVTQRATENSEKQIDPPTTTPATVEPVPSTQGRKRWKQLQQAVAEKRPLSEVDEAPEPKSLVNVNRTIAANTSRNHLNPAVIASRNTLTRGKNSSYLKIAEPTPEFQMAETFLQKWFICRAFDEKGFYIPSDWRQSDADGPITFLEFGFHPMSMFGSVCGILFIISFYFTILIEPYFAAYFSDVLSFSGISWAISVLFLLESIFNLSTPVKKPKNKDASRSGTRYRLVPWIRQYIVENAVFDTISMVPWSQLIRYEGIGFPLWLPRLLRFKRLAHMMSNNAFLIQIVYNIESIGGIGAMLSRIIPMGIVFVIFLHIEACFIYYIGSLNNFSTWDVQFDHWKYYPGGIFASDIHERYLWMLTQAVGNTFQMTFKPETLAEQATTLLFIVCGAILYALLVGLLSSAAVAYDSSGRLYRQKIDELTEYLNWKHIDEQTQKKVLGYYEYKYRGKYFEEQTLLADMNNSLRMELASINCRRLIEKVPFLKRELKDGRDEIYLGKISTALQAVYYVTGDFIFNQGEIGEEMFFIQTGTVNILTNGRLVTSFKDGAFFGEVALIANIPRTASVQAATNCTLYSLSSSQFADIISEFDDMKSRVDQIYKDRMEKIKMEKEKKTKSKGAGKMF